MQINITKRFVFILYAFKYNTMEMKEEIKCYFCMLKISRSNCLKN